MKKLTYLISLISLILLVSCGSIFAAETVSVKYINSNGTQSSSVNAQLLQGSTSGAAGTSIGNNNYYLVTEDSITTDNDNLRVYVPVGQTANIIFSGNVNFDGGFSFIAVPKGSTLNLYQAVSTNNTTSSSLTIDGIGDSGGEAYTTIGNDANLASFLKISENNFGTINFNSGIFSISNKDNNVAIGSTTSSGNAININSQAKVYAIPGTSPTADIIAVGVTETSNSCSINVNGGILAATSSPRNTSINVGNSGELNIDESGLVYCANPANTYFSETNSEPVSKTTWNIDSGVLIYFSDGKCNGILGGEVSIPTKSNFSIQGNNTNPGQLLYSTDTNGNLATLTVLKGSNLTLGNDTDNDGTVEPAILSLGKPGEINNFGTINIIITPNQINGSYYPGSWTNEPGSELNIGDNVTLQIYSSFKNGEDSTTSNGNATINLDGNILFNAPSGTSFTNYGTMSIGPIGYTNIVLTNEEGGTISSENPNYYGGTVWNMDLGSSALNYYTNQPNPNSTDVTIKNDPVTQYQDVGFSSFGDRGSVLPSFFDYTVSQINTTNPSQEPTTVASFTSPTGNDGQLSWEFIDESVAESNGIDNSYIGGYFLDGSLSSGSQNDNWNLIMIPSTSSVNPYSLILMYTGNNEPGVYELTAEPIGYDEDIDDFPYPYENPNAYNNQNFASGSQNDCVTYRSGTTDTLRLQVSTVTVNEVQITVGNQVITQTPYVVNIDETNVVDFGVLALNGNTPVTNYGPEKWTLTYASGAQCTGVAQLTNPETGVVRFLAPTNQILLLQVEVQGITAVKPIQVTGTGTAIHADITPVNNPLYLTADYAYDLDNNIRFIPSGVLASNEDADLPTVTYTVEDPNGTVHLSGSTIVATNSNIIGEYPVTATTTYGGETLTTTFTVNFTGQQPINPTGITAATSLTFNTIDAPSQNVNAGFYPTNTSMNSTQITGSDYYFTYTSSNEAVAIVNDYGEVTPVSAGTAVITTKINNISGLTTTTATTNVTVLESPADVPATDIIPDPSVIYLATSSVAEATHSQTITVTLEPQGCTSELTGTISAPSVASLTDNGDDTFTVTAVAEGRAVVTLTAGDVTKTVPVIVSDRPVIASDITASGTTPDSFTVTVSGVQPNPAIQATGGANVSNVSIFTWSGPDQVDKQFKVANDNNGTYTYTPFQVNGNEVNTWYFNADSINVECYAYLTSGSPVYLGAVTPNYSWVDAESAQGQNVAYITYQENNGFNRPTVFNGAVSGTVGQHLQLEGLRVSSCIEGVQVVTDVHEQNIGWVQGVLDGSYAGTQHEFRQIEAIRLRLTGANASNYDIYYQVHAEDIGWTGPVSNEQVAGTTGENRQIEAVQIQIVPKGTNPTGWATN